MPWYFRKRGNLKFLSGSPVCKIASVVLRLSIQVALYFKWGRMSITNTPNLTTNLIPRKQIQNMHCFEPCFLAFALSKRICSCPISYNFQHAVCKKVGGAVNRHFQGRPSLKNHPVCAGLKNDCPSKEKKINCYKYIFY